MVHSGCATWTCGKIMARSAILHDRNYGLLFFIELAVAHNVQMLKAANIYHFNCVINKVKFRETTAKCLINFLLKEFAVKFQDDIFH